MIDYRLGKGSRTHPRTSPSPPPQSARTSRSGSSRYPWQGNQAVKLREGHPTR